MGIFAAYACFWVTSAAEQYVNKVSGSHTVELLLYCGDVALQCESLPMWCSEVCTVFTLTKYAVVLHSSSRADSNTTNVGVHGVVIVFIGTALCRLR